MTTKELKCDVDGVLSLMEWTRTRVYKINNQFKITNVMTKIVKKCVELSFMIEWHGSDAMATRTMKININEKTLPQLCGILNNIECQLIENEYLRSKIIDESKLSKWHVIKR